jgi:hypothetical protein
MPWLAKAGAIALTRGGATHNKAPRVAEGVPESGPLPLPPPDFIDPGEDLGRICIAEREAGQTPKPPKGC